jgi:hypothetical protein
VSKVVSETLNRSYEDFRGNLGDRAEWAVNLLELNQAVSMVTSRCLQIARFLKYLRSGNFVAAAATLKTPVPKKVGIGKSFAGNYLEFHFGWAPLVKDIYTSVDILQSPIRDITARGKAKGKVTRNTVAGGIVTIGDYDVRVKHQALFAVTNPNLYLANQLGLVNPFTVVWELIPFSFVADWFVNVSTFCGQGSDLYGLTVKDQFTTRFVRGAGYLATVDKSLECWIAQWSVSRDTVLIGPDLVIRSQRLWHWRRMAAAASLVVQRLTR